MNANTEQASQKNINEILFDTRLRSHMDTYGWARTKPTGKEKARWQAIHRGEDLENNRKTAYIHIPFCGVLCTFCNFQRKAATPSIAAEYSRFVVDELQWYGQSEYVRQGNFEALYLGGGTPSLLPVENITELIKTACSVLHLNQSAEITMESTLHDLSADKLKAMADVGVNRISLGVQTFNEPVRKKLGRLSDKETIFSIIQSATEAGIKTISADILYRLPGGSVEMLTEDLQCVKELNLDGVSLYPLIAMDGTPLKKSLENGKITALAGIAGEIEQYKAARDFLNDAGYRQDTSTHFAKDTDRNLYASVRLDDGDCLPLGCGAGGYLAELVLMNAMDRQMYQSLISAGKTGYMAGLSLPAKSRMVRSAAGQIQRGFIDLNTVWNDGTISAEQLLGTRIEKFLQEGLLEHNEGKYRLTQSGWFWCYNLAAELSNICQQQQTDNGGYPLISGMTADRGSRPHPHALKYGSANTKHKPKQKFTTKDICILGVMCALVVVANFIIALALHAVGMAVVPGVMQFAMGFGSCLILYIALRKVPKTGALSIISIVYSMLTMLMSGSILMGLGLTIGGVSGDIAAKILGGMKSNAAIITALVVYRICQTTFSRLYAYVTDMTQVQFVWYLVAISIAASALGGLAGGLAGIRLSKRIKKAGVME